MIAIVTLRTLLVRSSCRAEVSIQSLHTHTHTMAGKVAADSLAFLPVRHELYVPSPELEWALSLLWPLFLWQKWCCARFQAEASGPGGLSLGALALWAEGSCRSNLAVLLEMLCTKARETSWGEKAQLNLASRPSLLRGPTGSEAVPGPPDTSHHQLNIMG